jgi:hypothetical protein
MQIAQTPIMAASAGAAKKMPSCTPAPPDAQKLGIEPLQVWQVQKVRANQRAERAGV